MVGGFVIGVVLTASVVLQYDGGFVGVAEAAPGATYSETISTPSQDRVMVSCIQGTLIATTSIVSNQFGVTGGDVATANDRGCKNSAPARSVGPLRVGQLLTAHLFCKGFTLIAVTPFFSNQFGVTGSSVAVTANSDRCR